MPGRHRPDCLAHGKAVHLRHHKVEHDDIGPRDNKGFERGSPVFRLDDLEPGRLKSLPMEKAFHIVVVDEQDDRIGPLIIHSGQATRGNRSERRASTAR